MVRLFGANVPEIHTTNFLQLKVSESDTADTSFASFQTKALFRRGNSPSSGILKVMFVFMLLYQPKRWSVRNGIIFGSSFESSLSNLPGTW